MKIVIQKTLVLINSMPHAGIIKLCALIRTEYRKGMKKKNVAIILFCHH